jgi:hypothetical protein
VPACVDPAAGLGGCHSAANFAEGCLTSPGTNVATRAGRDRLALEALFEPALIAGASILEHVPRLGFVLDDISQLSDDHLAARARRMTLLQLLTLKFGLPESARQRV